MRIFPPRGPFLGSIWAGAAQPTIVAAAKWPPFLQQEALMSLIQGWRKMRGSLSAQKKRVIPSCS